MEIALPPEFKEFLKLFNSHNCEYLLIGGYAVVYHGYSRPTDDLDIWIARTPENATKIVTALQDVRICASTSFRRISFTGKKDRETLDAYRDPDFHIRDGF